jgi:hypothetical protein
MTEAERLQAENDMLRQGQLTKVYRDYAAYCDD